MKILFIGDIYGNPGLQIYNEKIQSLKHELKPDILIVNGENAHHGRGINLKIYKELMKSGVHAITMGNWVWGNSELNTFIEESNIVRPANFVDAPGKGYKIINFNQKRLLIINVLGRVFMNPNIENPFTIIDSILNKEKADYIFVDVHAEATSEKVALGHYLDGRVHALVGTHTHIQTNDARILPKGTLYLTDVGMTGALNGVIGVKKDIVIDRFLKGFARPNETEVGDKQLNAVFLDLDKKIIKTIHLESK